MNENLKGFLSFLKALAIIAGITAVVIVGSTLLFCHEFGAAPTVEAFDVGAQIYELTQIADAVNDNYQKNVYDCSDMSIAFWEAATAKGYEVKLVIGNIDKKVETLKEADPCWVMVEVPGRALAIEVVGGYPVFDNDLYYYGWSFDTPKQFSFWVK